MTLGIFVMRELVGSGAKGNMAEFEQHEMPFENKRLNRARLRRGIFLIPSLFTVANLLCGYYASIATLRRPSGWRFYSTPWTGESRG
jgi:hypothetical protein